VKEHRVPSDEVGENIANVPAIAQCRMGPFVGPQGVEGVSELVANIERELSKMLNASGHAITVTTQSWAPDQIAPEAASGRSGTPR
jgi:hypothetical protein